MSDFVIRRWNLAPYDGDQAPRHVHHASDEAFCVLRGRLEVLLGEERRIITAGEFVTVPAGTTHTFRTVDAGGVDVLAVMTPEIDELVRALHEPIGEHERDALWARHRSSLAQLE